MLIFITDGEIIKIWGLHNITEIQFIRFVIYIYCRLESKAVWDSVMILLSHMWDTTFVVVSFVYCSSQMTQHVWSRCLCLCACACGSFSSTTCCPQAWIDRMKPPSTCHDKSLSRSLSLARSSCASCAVKTSQRRSCVHTVSHQDQISTRSSKTSSLLLQLHQTEPQYKHIWYFIISSWQEVFAAVPLRHLYKCLLTCEMKYRVLLHSHTCCLV